jgi:hypothetical protein
MYFLFFNKLCVFLLLLWLQFLFLLKEKLKKRKNVQSKEAKFCTKKKKRSEI